MHIYKDQLEFFLEHCLDSSEPEVQKINSGGLLYETDQTNDRIVILVNGDARIIDKQKTFSNQTVGYISSLYIFGLSKLFNRPYREHASALQIAKLSL